MVINCRNRVTLTEEQLKQIISDSVKQCLAELSKPFACEKYGNGENIDFNALKFPIKSYNDEDFIQREINEGLIKTYPKKQVADIVCRKFGLDESNIQLNDMFDGEGNAVTLLTVILPITASKATIGELIQLMRTCGYFPNGGFERSTVDKRFGGITFEPKFSEDITDLVRKKCRFLYHSTSATLVDKIMKNGLIPKSNNSLFLFPDRIYCMKGDNLTYLQKTQLKSIQDKRNSTEPYLRNPNDKLEYVLLKIDLTKISDDVRFYNDPAAPRAVFCHDNIPVSAIVEIIPFSL